MTPRAFIEKWGPGGPAYSLNEKQGAQSHFLDLCELLDVPKPGSEPGYLFEEGTRVTGAAHGFADAFKRGAFAWENKAPGRNLDDALRQLQGYSLALENPPLLVVCDRLKIRIHTQFNGHPSERHDITLQDLEQHDKRELLKRVWTTPESFRPRTTNRDITEAAAKSFATLAERLRARGNTPDAVAHFLTQCLFCCFAEDVGLLPGQLFDRLINAKTMSPERLGDNLGKLFEAMKRGGLFGVDDVPWFNGGLFQTIAVPRLDILDVTELRNAASKNWSAIDVSIFGTLFERGLDPGKRSQLGAHYTDPATIERIIDPVVRRPLLREWASARDRMAALLKKSKKRDDKAWRDAVAQHVGFLQRLAAYRVLDPACGSGNFLYLALKCLKDVEHLANTEAEALGLDRQVELATGPANVLGIELNEYAAELARVTVWIGELQWRLDHGYPFKTNPVLEPLDHIECRDALIAWVPVRAEPVEAAAAAAAAEAVTSLPRPSGERAGVRGTASEAATEKATEAPWPRADAVVGNPPFLGGSKKRGELGSDYFDALGRVFAGRVPGGADLVCYWFDKARQQIADGYLTVAGLVSTNSIRGGANRKVLEAICESTRIFEAWSDESWVNEGAAVRVSLVCFGQLAGNKLNGHDVSHIDSSLESSNGFEASKVSTLLTSQGAAFEGTKKYGNFEITGQAAREWLLSPNPNGQSNALVIRPWSNGMDVTKRAQDFWIIDFGVDETESNAALFERPFQHVLMQVKPKRVDKKWWLHERTRPQMRRAIHDLHRFMLTVRVSKHRLFVWRPGTSIPDTATVAIARADDATFGILHSRFHECWSLRMDTFLGVGNDPRYTPTTCFETFPFPEGLTPADTAHQQTEATASGALIPAELAESVKAQATRIAEAAARLNTLRENWLNPPEWTERVPEVVPLGMDKSPYPDRTVPKAGLSEADAKALAKRTLTNLYNQRPAWLAMAHEALDAAVAAAYGWTDVTPHMTDDALLARLLALNLQRSAA
ncbi:DNA methyltransferase [Hydrogenophaga sp.]|uniref:class I SAM-dependent DNA methyltransferase n=1 Tax=Hydrogenophaga sp. TaxID=1904254 RepID=UPI00271B1F90|nr:DNA methyltransferase [Hydrogenophaga sp.]MDO9606338.1 hypothetical protein [Hydrogenophaga sp.]